MEAATHVAMPLWRAFAGLGGTYVLLLRSRVYYFPQGHAEQCPSPPDFSASDASLTRPDFLCRVDDLALLAHPETDEVFAKIILDPAEFKLSVPRAVPEASGSVVECFSKILTVEDMIAIRLPNKSAESFFPQHKRNADDGRLPAPVEIIAVHDVHGTVWKFRLLYQWQRPHALTDWKDFRESKNIVSGDSLVFAKERGGKISVGVRRTSSLFRGSDITYVRPETVVETVKLAERGDAFEVTYFPRAGALPFVVAEEVVDRAMEIEWAVGMRVRMPRQAAEDGFVRGTVSAVIDPIAPPWPLSPWRMLQVTWDLKDASQCITKVSPWHVQRDDAS